MTLQEVKSIVDSDVTIAELISTNHVTATAGLKFSSFRTGGVKLLVAVEWRNCAVPCLILYIGLVRREFMQVGKHWFKPISAAMEGDKYPPIDGVLLGKASCCFTVQTALNNSSCFRYQILRKDRFDFWQMA